MRAQTDRPTHIHNTHDTQLLTKLYNMGLIPTKKSLAQVEKLSASAFCRCVFIHVYMDGWMGEPTGGCWWRLLHLSAVYTRHH